MKVKTFLPCIVTFAVGVLAGWGFFLLTSEPDNPPVSPPLSSVSPSEANRLYHNYYDRATATTGVYMGFYVERDQLDVLNAIAADPAIAGFRVYMGSLSPDRPDPVTLIVGVNANQTEVFTLRDRVYMAKTRVSDPCPPSCDRTRSEITR